MTAEFPSPETNGHAAAKRALELQSLRENAERFRLLVENSQDVVFEVTDEGNLLYVSPNAKAVLGYEPVELLNTSFFAHVHPDDLPLAHEQVEMPEGWVTCRYRHKDGSWRWLEITGSDLLSPSGQTRTAIIARDVSRRIEAERALGENQRLLSTLLSNMSGTAYRSRNDVERTIEFISHGCRELTGFAPEDFVGNRQVCFGQLIVSEDRQSVWDQIQAALQARKPFELHYRIRTAAGAEKWVWDCGQGIFSAQGELLALEGFLTDVTERHKAEEARNQLEAQLRQAQKLDALGTLAGGIAHDFNNILTVILAYTELAHVDANEPDEARSHLVEIRKASEHAKNLVHQILTFSRHQKQERKPARLQLVVKEALKLLRSTLPATVEIDARIDSDTPVVLADPTQIHQVVMNLCVNAAHAMQERPGRLTVILQAFDVDEALAQTLHGLRPERYARLTVSDTGHGIDAETLKHIFEPFFTTKGPGEGTGLGLPVVHGIVKEHEGVIAVQSQLGVGTAFDVYFPIHQTTPVEAPEIPAMLPRGCGEHILFVDDEPAICTSAQIILERLGYRVTVQTNPTEAIIQFFKCPDQFALVITDLTMPRVTGSDLAQQISRLRPKMPVLLATGFNDAWTPDKLREFGIRELLAKPITPMVLATTVQRALNPEV